MVEAFTLPVTLEMAGKPLLQQMGRSAGEMYCLGTPQTGNRWGCAPVVGPTGHLNRQTAHLHLLLRTRNITSYCFRPSNMHCYF